VFKVSYLKASCKIEVPGGAGMKVMNGPQMAGEEAAPCKAPDICHIEDEFVYLNAGVEGWPSALTACSLRAANPATKKRKSMLRRERKIGLRTTDTPIIVRGLAANALNTQIIAITLV
jgi:hypothetical protein